MALDDRELLNAGDRFVGDRWVNVKYGIMECCEDVLGHEYLWYFIARHLRIIWNYKMYESKILKNGEAKQNMRDASISKFNEENPISE